MDKERPWGAGPMVTGGSRGMECRVCLCVPFLDKPKPPPVVTLALTGTCNLSGPRKELYPYALGTIALHCGPKPRWPGKG